MATLAGWQDGDPVTDTITTVEEKNNLSVHRVRLKCRGKGRRAWINLANMIKDSHLFLRPLIFKKIFLFLRKKKVIEEIPTATKASLTFSLTWLGFTQSVVCCSQVHRQVFEHRRDPWDADLLPPAIPVFHQHPLKITCEQNQYWAEKVHVCHCDVRCVCVCVLIDISIMSAK